MRSQGDAPSSSEDEYGRGYQGPRFLSSRSEGSMRGEWAAREELLDFSKRLDWGKERYSGREEWSRNGQKREQKKGSS